jgi:glycosyltransferase involved in cell wall biosynthesis
LSLVKSEQVKFQCTIVGDSNERVEFENLAIEFNLYNEVKFVGTKTPTELITIYAESDFFLLTSNFETFGVVLIEALACGLPIVATNVGAVPEIVNSTNGLLAQSNNSNDIAEKIVMMIQNKNNYAKLSLSESVKEKYSPMQIANKFSKLYAQVLNV